MTTQAARTFKTAPQVPIIVHSHLHWDWVWQRPQQFISRLSSRHPVLFVDALQVVKEDIAPRFEIERERNCEGVTILKMFFSRRDFACSELVDREREALLCKALRGPLAGKFERPIQWFYDPMAVTAFAGKFNERAIVYDCMDELSSFKFAQSELARRERELFRRSDLVFCGGRKLWESKKRFNANCHFYGCGVDVAHFAQARAGSTPVPADIADLPSPVLGYFGVVDERLDYELIAKLADANSSWNICMIGPHCKIEESDLPQRPNLHWLGGRKYSALPAYAKAFDVCLMPFAINDATAFINPTKALEYMATGTPIVSTPIADVISNFSDVVGVAASHEEFISKCYAAANAPDRADVERGLTMAQSNTWENIVAKLEGHLQDVLAHRSTPDRSSFPTKPEAVSLQSCSTL